mmetsp:Transcript_7744/g.19231  ORF Transcript_7744/g.19231 Transcript_7744/m.19231 type:complete len:665 (+) Transcript_7744:833-2827(+)
MTVKMTQRSTSALTTTTSSSSPMSVVKEQFEASASKLWSTVKTFKTDSDTMTTTTSATNSTMKKQQLQQQQQQQQDDSLMSTSSHSRQSRESGDDNCSYSSIRSHLGTDDQNNPQVLFQSVLHAMFSSCTTGVPYQAPVTNNCKASRREKDAIGSSNSHRTRSKHRNKSSPSSSSRSAMGDSDLFLEEEEEEEEEEEQQIKNETRHSEVGGGGDAADPVAATANHKSIHRTQKAEKLRRPVDVVVQSTSKKLSSATKKLFSSSSDAAAAVHAVNHLRETQAAQQQERQKQLVQSLLEQKQRRQERRGVHSSIVQSVATSAATASHHHQDRQDDFMMFQGRTQNNKKMSGSEALFSPSSDHPAARKDRPSSSSFFPASNPFRNKPREVSSSSPPRKPNGKAYPTISYGSSFDLDDDGVSVITQHTVDVMVQVMEKEDQTVPYIQRVFSDCTDHVDTQFAQWNDANAPVVESSQDATTPSTTMQTMSSPPRFSRETRSTGAHSFFTKTSQSTETEDIHSVWKKEEQQYWASLVENDGKVTATSPLKSRRSRGTRKSSHTKQRLEDLPEEWKVSNDLSTGTSGVPSLRLKKIRSLRTTVDERNRMTNHKGSIIAPRRVNSSNTTWRKNKTVFSASSEKKDYGDGMIGFVMTQNNSSNYNGRSDFAEI